MPKSKAPYPAQFRQQMVELVHAGRKPRELAKEFGCHGSASMVKPALWPSLAVCR
jgi:transposase-like protein